MKIIISGGGTAGHINPALAVAEILKQQGHEILFVGAEGKMEMERVPRAGFKIEGLPVAGLQRKLTLSNLKVPFKLLKSLSRARSIINTFNPDVVAGFGGYASAPIVKAAQKRGIRTVLQEQNSFAGLTNRMLAKRADRICVAYQGMERFFAPDKIVLTGNPLRGALRELPDRTEACQHFALDPNRRTILVVGGSLGTRTLNEMVIAAASLPDHIQMIWQCGKYYHAEMTQRAAHLNPLAFIERMDYAYAAADVVITRAGASTISELQLIGKPTLFVPSPNVAQDHQSYNARSLVDHNAALMVTDSQAVEQAIPLAIELLQDPLRAQEMSTKMRSMGKPNAAADVAAIICNQP